MGGGGGGGVGGAARQQGHHVYLHSLSQSNSPLHRFHATERHSRDFIHNLYKRITSLIASDLPVPTLG